MPEEEPRGPEPERLNAGEVDLTGSTQNAEALVKMIADALDAMDNVGTLPLWGARAIARALTDWHDQGPEALHQFAATGRANVYDFMAQLERLSQQLPMDSISQNLIDRLGGYFMGLAQAAVGADGRDLRDVVLHVSEATEADREATPAGSPTMPEEAHERYGAAFRAFLTLPAVAEDQPDVIRQFERSYMGSFASMIDVINTLTPAEECLTVLRAAARAYGFSEFVVLDYRALAMKLRETWRIVFLDGQVHVFGR